MQHEQQENMKIVADDDGECYLWLQLSRYKIDQTG
jgi:hypothetical protein